MAGWLETKCVVELTFSNDEPLLTSKLKDFIKEVYRGPLGVSHMCTHELVRTGLCFVKKPSMECIVVKG